MALTKSLIDIPDQIFDIFESDRQANQLRTNSRGRLFSQPELLMSGRGGMDHQATRIPDVRQVRENFQKVFKSLFTEEDQGDLILVDPTNLAESGIDIIAKPKGKRPTSITQLSGGEKTLTATALLFAIYLIKPAPFCILDEVDAPLDDANVGKFTQMIRKFSKESQFIIVTHNKMTMASVDVIYGVTMQEPGVSKLVPVDFRGLDHQFVN